MCIKLVLLYLDSGAWLNWVEAALPNDMLGSDFLKCYASHYDEATTSIDPNAR
mgnify:FL=1